MEHQAHEVALGPVHEGGQQRVAAEPVQVAQRGVRRHAIHRHLQPLRGQRARLGLRAGLGEIAAVADAAREWKAPAVQRQRIGRRRHHVPHGGGAAQVGVAAVAGVVGQVQRVHGEGAGALRQLQPLAQRRRGGVVGDPRRQRAGRLHQRQVPAQALPVVAQLAVLRATSQQPGQREPGQAPPCKGIRPSKHALTVPRPAYTCGIHPFGRF